ncbi:hypothetical protein Q5P01_023976 [Channa striata]|uniref:Uncharacterized protein n=1 Tax=Channa striata TaxID=64152 RepID=A0AA88J356_CHASR|nr:hypothetical protein Q5P01_023976 [Channa striata]
MGDSGGCGAQEIRNQTLRTLFTNASYFLLVPKWDRGRNRTQRLDVSDHMACSVLDQQRLWDALALANNHVKLLLKVLEMLYQEILRGCQELKAFLIKFDRSVVDCETAAFVQQKLLGIIRAVEPAHPQNEPPSPTLQLSAPLVIKKPVVFDRSESCAGSNSVNLCWKVVGELFKDPRPNLISDRFYQFSAKRVASVSLVYGGWTDTLIMETLAGSK